MRSRQVLKSVLMTLFLQCCIYVCGLILPRLFISYYGSEVNGLVNSINQFLVYVALLESGVGGVIQAAFYKPLAEHDEKKLSGVVKAGNQFYQKIALITAFYVVILAVAYPWLVDKQFSWIYTASLVVILGLSSIFQYFFGLINCLLINADQKQWIPSLTQAATVVLNAVVCCILIVLHCPVHVVKLASAFIFILRPLVYYAYVKRHYHIDNSVAPDEKAIQQKWDGMGQHIATFVHLNTDIVVLTLMDTLKNVSVYSVYQGIVSGIQNVATALSQGIRPTIGNMLALHENENLHQTFDFYEQMNSMVVSVLYSTTALCIIPFMQIYMKGIVDANYIQPTFAYVLIAASAMYSFRSPYADVCYAAGMYKATAPGAYVEAALNLILSFALVKRYGLTGIAIGTMVAMTSHTGYFIWFLRNRLLNRPVMRAFWMLFLTIMSVMLNVFVIRAFFSFPIDNFALWIAFGFLSIVLSSLLTFGIFLLFYRRRTIAMVRKTVQVFAKRK